MWIFCFLLVLSLLLSTIYVEMEGKNSLAKIHIVLKQASLAVLKKRNGDFFVARKWGTSIKIYKEANR
ncbi:unnamed protein product [Meloidogyne enterolobii]|uniref:Uncharacterized protein n=1 Tax=Meloidogyne enterolobii TaxID=390850 RepID=A0ACB0ZGD1_MELEN